MTLLHGWIWHKPGPYPNWIGRCWWCDAQVYWSEYFREYLCGHRHDCRGAR